MLGSPAGPGVPTQRTQWPLAPAPPQCATNFTADGFGKYGVYSLFPGGPSFGSALYTHASTIGRFASSHMQQQTASPFHTAHKESLFSSSGYTFGAPTPPPGSPYSPVPVTQLELLTKGFNSNIIIQQPASEYPPSPKKIAQIQEKRCDEKCCSLKLQKPCNCQLSPKQIVRSDNSSVKYVGDKFSDNSGCSRTNPIEWSSVNVKKEPGTQLCQLTEVNTNGSPIIKVEISSPTQKNGEIQQMGLLSNSIMNSNGNGIPLGIAVARQRLSHDVITSPSLPPTGLLTTVTTNSAQIKEVARISEIDSAGGMAATSNVGGTGGGTLLQCTDDRGAPLATWPMGGAHSSALTTPTLWQYPASVPMEPVVPVPFPPMGLQLVREPSTGGLLLLPTATGIEPLQQAVVWPSYHQPSSVFLPPLPPPPLQLLSSASSDYLQSSTTLHQHTQTHSTRLVALTTDTKRKIPLPIPTTTLIKIETDANSLDQTKALQAVSTIGTNTGTVYTDQSMAPLVTTHVIYQHPTNLILSQTPTSNSNSNNNETVCRSQATSPVACLTPPPENLTVPEEEPQQTSTTDASNQTDTPICSEDDNTTHTVSDVIGEAKPTNETNLEEPNNNNHSASNNNNINNNITTVPEEEIVEPLVQQEEVETNQEEPVENHIIVDEPSKQEVPPPDVALAKPDLSGLELLSNSIVVFENCRNSVKIEEKPKIVAALEEPPNLDDSLGGLDLLCALAEQRILEEKCIFPKESKKSRKKEKRKSKKHHHDEPKPKKIKTPKEQNEQVKCNCRSYKNSKSEEEVKKFIASKSHTSCCEGDWPCMNAMELDMRMKLADLQRQYREKQKELSKLKTKKHHTHECSKKRSRKKSTHSDRSKTLTPPPLLEKVDTSVNVNSKTELIKPPTLCAYEPESNTPEICDKSKTVEKSSSSKKRKVGRPKKLLSSCDSRVGTETIVAKKPKKGSFVGYLLAAKEKLQRQNVFYSDSPPRYLEETVVSKPRKHRKSSEKSSKMRPKLKAEPTIKTYQDYDEDDNEGEEEKEKEQMEIEAVKSCNEDDPEDHIEEDMEIENEEIEEIEIEEPIIIPDSPREEPQEPPPEAIKEEEVFSPCTLTSEHLEVDKLRVLTAMGGLFYAGHLNALEPPDVYSITLDGERGNRPHIMSREEILRDAIVEISPKTVEELVVGTRLCAYWSQQYRCLYPGSVAEPGTPDPALDSKFVAVEFDDGDSGRIALEDIRLLPPNYPIIEYDPNPLQSLSKRRRRASTSISVEERVAVKPVLKSEPNLEKHKERKRLKKKKREKLKQKQLNEQFDKKKKKKHKCVGENCKHKKHHKKHRKHKKHHKKVEPRNEEETTTTTTEDTTEIEEISTGEEDVTKSDLQSVPEEMAVEDFSNTEVTIDDILESKKSKKIRDRQESCESRSKMSAFLPARQLWGWAGKDYKRIRGKGRSRKFFYKTIQRGKETISVGDSAVFLSTGRPDRPYIGAIEAMWEMCGTMVVKVKWFYHPEETVGCPMKLQYPGALFESPHVDENDVQTISHKCEVLPLKMYTERLGQDPVRYETIYDNNDIYYLAGSYDPTTKTLKMEPGIPFSKSD